MNYWWVNQNKTWKQEISGGFMWSPKIMRDGRSNHFYENMRRVEIGDVVFSFFSQHIQYLGIVTHRAKPGPKPEEFGGAGSGWNHEGWIVPTEWHKVPNPYRPRDMIETLRPLIPEKYHAINRETGKGLQGVYLASIPDALAEALLLPLGEFRTSVLNYAPTVIEDDGAILAAEDEIVKSVLNNTDIDETEKEAIVKSRRGQGRFRSNLMSIEQSCRVTGVSDPRLLRASHIKPWRACETHQERIDGYNGLLLSPTIDHLFDNGFISFSNDGTMLISQKIEAEQLELLGIDPYASINVGEFSKEQATYLQFHRENIFD